MSSTPDEPISVRIPSDTKAGLELQEKIVARVEALEYSPQDSFGIRLALEEALVNAIKHGNGSDPGKSVFVSYTVGQDEVEVVIEDEGEGFNPADVPDCTLEENLERPSGRGIMLMRSFMSHVEYSDKGNRLTMRKSRTPEAP